MKRVIENYERTYDSLREAIEQAPSDVHAWCVANGAQLEGSLSIVEREDKGVACACVSRVVDAPDAPDAIDAIDNSDSAAVETPRTSEP